MPSIFNITNQTGGIIPRRKVFIRIKNKILGKKYHLGLTFITSAQIKKLNKSYRNKDKPTDILSFPIDKNIGDIYICPAQARIMAKKFDRPYDNFLLFLFIHGCVHLKGYDHGGTMDRIEAKIRKQFKV